MTDWPETANRYIAYFDVMGFKELVFRNEHTTILQKMEVINNAIKHTFTVTEEGKPPVSLVKSVLFSDSILLISRDDSFTSLFAIASIANMALGTTLTNGLSLKGAIAKGIMTADFQKSIYVGVPLIDAYNLQKEFLLYGVVVHNTAEQEFVSLHSKNKDLGKFGGCEQKTFYRYKVPFKGSKVYHYVLNWGYFADEKDNLVDPNKAINLLYSVCSGSTRIYVDNTVEFLEWMNKQTG